MSNEEEMMLSETSRNMKATVQIIQEKISQQDLLYESIEAETEKADRALMANIDRFGEAIKRMNNDPRNKIIFILALILIMCISYLII
ncbi:hypothetical protein HK407_05g09570 [Ordospora pajunii]|uniref:uncharacterized protein n=1 Tax=Ordospora pajunii TaxID=3039483 RepID=UPI0029527927|nr:uncharacterized protein HK407_05g09570 [Ordospora pajunii]KAH9411438.1 hypothetical protein HK407_05g09570 [Ordospora pajunii]